MKGKPLRIDWDELESAFDNDREDVSYYLDLVTGQVVLEGEGEEEDFEHDPNHREETPAAAPRPRNDAVRLYVEPPVLDDELAWMEEFVEGQTELDPSVVARLNAAIDAESLEEFRETLRAGGELRDRWFLFRSGRLHEMIEAWLTEHQIRWAEPPPWK